ncbi:MAG: dTDP-glucose 4,6-dehydratase [Candidatus Cloacimonetes bacterium]|nr:dTDP-glucose 4,6-dehydratase [Candidatus Cloacimonadota bacterium]
MTNNKRVLVTGGAGFVGSNLVRYLLKKYPHYQIVNFDKLTESGSLSRLSAENNNPNYLFVNGDISSERDVQYVFEEYKPDYIIHLASQSYIDRNIHQPGIFIQTNVIGTQNILLNARTTKTGKIVQVSTSKVYGSTRFGTGKVNENTPMRPCDPYSASKAAADLFVQAAYRAHNLDINIIRPTNIYGPFQFPEKLIPTVIGNILNEKDVPVFGDGQNLRDWIYIDDYCNAIDLVLHKGTPGEIYNISSGDERKNIDLIRMIMKMMTAEETRLEFLKDRLGDESYPCINSDHFRAELDWKPKFSLEKGLAKTIDWYKTHTDWTDEIYSGDYQKQNQELQE